MADSPDVLTEDIGYIPFFLQDSSSDSSNVEQNEHASFRGVEGFDYHTNDKELGLDGDDAGGLRGGRSISICRW